MRKNVFFGACNTHFTSIAHYFNPRLQKCTEMLVFSIFFESRGLPYLFFKNGNIKRKKWNIENLTKIQYILVQYSDPISVFYNFITLLSIYTYLNGNYQIKTNRILNACKNKTSHANT